MNSTTALATTDKTKDNFKLVKETKPYVYKGIKNVTAFPEFVNLCKLSQKKLKKKLTRKMKGIYGIENVYVGDGYVYCKGTVPVLLTAHMDTVHKEQIRDFYEEITPEGKHILSSPQGIGGDDRCGIYMILDIVRRAKQKPYVLFCEDEEIGGKGSDKFTQTKYIKDLEGMKFLIEVDRANDKDLVFYEDGNSDFHSWCEKVTGYEENWGTFSDISILSPECKVSSVNISCGYYNEHTLKETVVIEEMLASIKAIEKLIEASEDVEQFEYIHVYHNMFERCYGYDFGYDYDGWGGYNYNGYTSSAKGEGKYALEVWYYGYNKEEFWAGTGATESEAWMNFFFENDSIAFCDVLDYNCYSI